MQLHDAIALINHPQVSTGVPTTWADFGCGAGLFTNALATLLAPGSKIYAVDKNVKTFRANQHTGDVYFQTVNADFTADSINIGDLDGILMANSLHFVSDKISFIKQCVKYFRGQKVFLIVEYDTDTPNPWVPYPVSFESLSRLFMSLGFSQYQKIYELRSQYNRNEIYSTIVRQ